MSWLEAATSIVASVAWPGVVVTAIVLMRKPLRRLVGRLESYEGAGQKFSFGKAVEELEEKVGDELGRATEASRVTGGGQGGRKAGVVGGIERRDHPVPDFAWANLAQLAQVSGSAAVIEAWRGVELALTSLFDQARAVRGGAEEARRQQESVPRMLTYLSRVGVLSPENVSSIRQLSTLRNQAAHTDVEISENEALGYSDLALSIARALTETEVDPN